MIFQKVGRVSKNFLEFVKTRKPKRRCMNLNQHIDDVSKHKVADDVLIKIKRNGSYLSDIIPGFVLLFVSTLNRNENFLRTFRNVLLIASY